MKRYLYLLRHGKSDWSRALSDHERPLAERGKKESKRLGTYLFEHGHVPDLLLCSTAVRARQTVRRMISGWGEATPDIEYDESLYLASADELLQVICKIPAGIHSLMIAGHNPGLEMLLMNLAGAAMNDLGEGTFKILPTASVACLEIRGGWRELAPENCDYQWRTRGRKL